MKTRTALFVSDSTGITAEALGHSIISQFDHITWCMLRFPFIDTIDRVPAVHQAIQQATQTDGQRPIVFMTVISSEISKALHEASAYFIDFFENFIVPLEKELEHPSSHSIGKTHQASGGLEQQRKYEKRIAALNFSLTHDDGGSDLQINEAELILIGVSRSGKTPTSLYMAMQYSLWVANVPLIPEDFERASLPDTFYTYKEKMYGLTCQPEYLSRVREQRYPNSQYASLSNCYREIKMAEKIMQREGIHFLDSTHRSVEEICSTIMDELHLGRQH